MIDKNMKRTSYGTRKTLKRSYEDTRKYLLSNDYGRDKRDMITIARCIDRVRNKFGVIQEYVLIDTKGRVMKLEGNDLKAQIRAKVLHVENLKLTSDNKLMMKKATKDKQIEGKTLHIKIENKNIDSSKVVEQIKAIRTKAKLLGNTDIIIPAIYKLACSYGLEDILVIYKITLTSGEVVPIIDYKTTTNIWMYPESLLFTSKIYFKYLINDETDIDLGDIEIMNLCYLNDLFFDCNSIVNVDFKNFSNCQINSMRNTFYNCFELRHVDLSALSKNKIRVMERTFGNCVSLQEIDLSALNLTELTKFTKVFTNNTMLKSVIISKEPLYNVVSVDNAFEGCIGLRHLDLRCIHSNKIVSAKSLFENCVNITGIDISNMGSCCGMNAEKMFYGCKNLKSICTDKCMSISKADQMFCGCEELEYLDLLSFDFSNLLSAKDMFTYCNNIKQIRVAKNQIQKLVSLGVNIPLNKCIDYSGIPMG